MLLRSARLAALAALLILLPAALQAGEVTETYDFKLDTWNALDVDDGPIKLHRMRLDLVEGRLSKAALSRPYNQEYLETVRIQLEYTNEADRKWKARITARWLDKDGEVIDGLSANETLDKKSARKITQVSLSTLKYGLERAEKLEIGIHYEP